MNTLLPKAGVLSLAFVCGACYSYAQVDCVYPGHVAASRVDGQVYDSFGTVVPGVAITLTDERGSKLEAKTDDQGRFRIAAASGKYSFKATFAMFETSQTSLDVGADLAGLLHPSKLYVILGLNGSNCPWVTTSQKKFRQIVNSNKKRSEESSQQHAT
jgi:hypothetical protein